MTETSYRIYSRTSEYYRWRIVTPRPHGERYPFDSTGLLFASIPDAKVALDQLRAANDAQFMIIEALPAREIQP